MNDDVSFPSLWERDLAAESSKTSNDVYDKGRGKKIWVYYAKGTQGTMYPGYKGPYILYPVQIFPLMT